MRVLVVADYPPPYGPVVDATVAEVRTLRALGHEVEVCSPAPSAAPHCEVVAYGLGPEHLLGEALADARGLAVEHRPLGASAAPGRASSVAAERGAWPGADRDAVMHAIRVRAAQRRGAGDASVADERRTAPLRRLAPLALPAPVSLRPGASLLKRLVRRLTAWQIDPIVGQVNRLREALVVTLEQGDDASLT